MNVTGILAMKPDDQEPWWHWQPFRRHLVFTIVALLVWGCAATAMQDILLWGAFLYVFCRRRLRTSSWFSLPGLIIVTAGIWGLLHIPLSVLPSASVRDLIRDADILAAVLAIPVIFDTKPKLHRALIYSAIAITLLVAVDAVRLALILGRTITTGAHTFKPFLFGHPNNASIMSGAAALVFGCLMVGSWRKPARAAACLAGVVVNIVYLWIAASRGPQLAFALACGFSGFCLPGWRRKAVWLLGMVMVATLLFFHAEKINRRFSEKKDLGTFVDRTKVWAHTWALAAERPLSGYGYGQRVFKAVYYASDPPKSPHTFPHCHQYWLNILFSQGWIGVILLGTAWGWVTLSLIRCIACEPEMTGRVLPVTVLMLILFLQAYNLGDLTQPPASILLIWLLPSALVLSCKRSAMTEGHQALGA